ncbi:ionotropic glutamate receptor [Holotrichia oblita]|uniref:Ionotropic glutamate receptor n=1 Tax=Holotrichia oblita TaxID=644536 RepID=A0ACB9T6M3_HOLOL|nr:ionotropic glutamate receptor [Holotrichia oblita]
MGLVDLVLLGLCANLTCPGDKIRGYLKITFSDTAAIQEEIIRNQARLLRNYTLKIATVHNPPLSSITEVDGILQFGGIAYDVIEILRKKFNFEYEIVKPPEDSLNVEDNGIVGMLSRNEVDVAAAFLPAFPYISNHLHFSISLSKAEWVVLMKRPPVSATGSGLLAPFTFQVWLLILVSLFAVGPIIYLLILLQTRLCRTDDNPVYPLPSCVWFVYGALLKQGSTLSPRTGKTTKTILFATWWIFITILTAFYTANLTAFLTLSKFTLPINTISDIGAKKSTWVSQKGNAIEAALDNDVNFKTSLQGSHSEFLEEDGTSILENWVRRRDYMYIGERPIVDHLMYRDYLSKVDPNIAESDRCTFVVTTWTVTENLRAFAYSPNFPFIDLFNNILMHLVESGIVMYSLREGLPDTQICPLDLGSKERQLQNTDLIMTYYIVVGGFIVSTIAFLIELLCTKCNGKIKSNKQSRADTLFTVAEKKGRMDENRLFPPPPPYHALFKPPFPHSENATTKNVNGRDYWVIKSVDGNTRLIPIRAPSAFLFQYDN